MIDIVALRQMGFLRVIANIIAYALQFPGITDHMIEVLVLPQASGPPCQSVDLGGAVLLYGTAYNLQFIVGIRRHNPVNMIGHDHKVTTVQSCTVMKV